MMDQECAMNMLLMDLELLRKDVTVLLDLSPTVTTAKVSFYTRDTIRLTHCIQILFMTILVP